MSILFSCSLCLKDINIINDCEVAIDDFCFSDVFSKSTSPNVPPQMIQELVNIGGVATPKTILTESQIHDILTKSQLPLCTLCLANTIHSLETERDLLSTKFNAYKAALSTLSSLNEVYSCEDCSSSPQLYASLHEQQLLLEAEQYSYFCEINRLKEEIQSKQNQYRDLSSELSSLVLSSSQHHSSLTQTSSSLESYQLSHSSTETAVINSNHLGVELPVENFNNSLSNPLLSVNWEETNIAFGDLCLLLSNCGQVIQHKFKNFTPIAQGKESSILRTDDGAFLPLFGPPFSSRTSSSVAASLKKARKQLPTLDEGLMGLAMIICDLFDKCVTSHQGMQDFAWITSSSTEPVLPYPIIIEKTNVVLKHGSSSFGLLLKSYGVTSSGDVEKFKGERALKWTSSLRLLARNIEVLASLCNELSFGNKSL
ncbi:hypothetical protein GEMRC1_008345 [Eukaryota sp. GEM-RC1]